MAQTAGTSSPAPGGFRTLQEEIGYYKSQYKHLESELQEFQASSRDLEAEMEKDIEASEKREKDLKQKVESLRYEVDEWKVGIYRQDVKIVILTRAIDQIQTVESGSQYRSEQPSERDHDATRHESDTTTQITGYRSRKR